MLSNLQRGMGARDERRHRQQYGASSHTSLLVSLGRRVAGWKTRALIIEHQGLETWNHADWDQAGGEHLASIIAWAIEGTHPSAIGYYDADHLAEAYRLATQSLTPQAPDSATADPVLTVATQSAPPASSVSTPEFQ